MLFIALSHQYGPPPLSSFHRSAFNSISERIAPNSQIIDLKNTTTTPEHTHKTTKPTPQQRNREFERHQISWTSDIHQPPSFTHRSIASLWTTGSLRESSEEILIALNSNTSPPILIQCAISQQISESNQVEKSQSISQ